VTGNRRRAAGAGNVTANGRSAYSDNGCTDDFLRSHFHDKGGRISDRRNAQVVAKSHANFVTVAGQNITSSTPPRPRAEAASPSRFGRASSRKEEDSAPPAPSCCTPDHQEVNLQTLAWATQVADSWQGMGAQLGGADTVKAAESMPVRKTEA